MDLGPLVGTYDSALSSIVKMKRADVNSKNFPLFSKGKRVPFPLPRRSVGPQLSGNNTLCLLRQTHSWKCFFFPPLPFPPPAIMSFPFLTRSHPSFLPPYKPWVMNEVLKIENLNAGLLQFACLSSFIPQSRQSFCAYSSAGLVRHASVSGRYYFSSRCLLWADVKLFVRRNSRAV